MTLSMHFSFTGQLKMNGVITSHTFCGDITCSIRGFQRATRIAYNRLTELIRTKFVTYIYVNDRYTTPDSHFCRFLDIGRWLGLVDTGAILTGERHSMMSVSWRMEVTHRWHRCSIDNALGRTEALEPRRQGDVFRGEPSLPHRGRRS